MSKSPADRQAELTRRQVALHLDSAKAALRDKNDVAASTFITAASGEMGKILKVPSK